jgi:hypothetical protein
MKRSEIIVNEKITGANSETSILSRMQENQGEGYYRDSAKYKEVVWEGTLFKMYKKPRSVDDVIFKKGFFLFNAVRANALAYLKEREGKAPIIEEQPVNFTNYYFDIENKEIVGVDLTAAYWYVAKNLGIITEKTFQKGLTHISVEYNGETKEGDLLKPMRLSALSVLGKKKTYFKIVNGEKTKEPVVIGGHEELEKLYKLIRFTCYTHMKAAKDIIGTDEFLMWKTDCIYFHDTPQNRKKVTDYFDSVNMEWKTLEKE